MAPDGDLLVTGSALAVVMRNGSTVTIPRSAFRTTDAERAFREHLVQHGVKAE